MAITLAKGGENAAVAEIAKAGKARFFLLEPSDEENLLNFAPLYVRGPFRIAKKFNAAKRAREEWKAFRGSA